MSDRTAPSDEGIPRSWEELLATVQARSGMPSEDLPLGRLTRDFFANNWAQCRDGLLTRTRLIRVWPEPSPAPSRFRFEFDCPYKARLRGDAPIQWMPGPVRGHVAYRGDLFEFPDGPSVAVKIDRDLGFFHPNHKSGHLCVGDLANLRAGPIPLDQLLASHIYPIVSYQNRRPSHPLDIDAARYFALEPDAMQGLEPPQPLY